MLREVRCKHIKPRVSTFILTTTASGATLSNGYSDFTVTRGGVGAGLLIPRQPYSRNGFIHLTQSSNNGGYGTYNATSGTGSSFAYSILNAGGSAVEGTVEGITFGFDSTDANITKVQRVVSTSSAERVNFGKITGSSGAVAIGTGDFRCTRTATGVYAITFKRPFGQIPIVCITASGNAASTGTLSSRTANGVTVTMAPQTGTPTDSDFYIVVVGQDSRSDAGRERSPLACSQRLPRIVAAEITNTAGAWSATIGQPVTGAGTTNGDILAAITDNGAGDFTITINDVFKREPAILVTTTTQRANVVSYTNGAIRVQTRNSGGTAADTNGVTHVIMFGSDDASEY